MGPRGGHKSGACRFDRPEKDIVDCGDPLQSVCSEHVELSVHLSWRGLYMSYSQMLGCGTISTPEQLREITGPQEEGKKGGSVQIKKEKKPLSPESRKVRHTNAYARETNIRFLPPA